jgi:hypothetical protein
MPAALLLNVELRHMPAVNTDPDNPCPTCNGPVGELPVFALTDTRGYPLCPRCAEAHSAPGEQDLFAALDNIDTTLAAAAPEDRPAMVALTLRLLDQLVDHYKAIAS